MKKIILLLTFVVSTLFSVAANQDTCKENKVIKHENCYEIIKYYASGGIEEIEFYDLNKQKTGIWKRYNETGILIGQAEFKEGEKSGEWKLYDNDGKLITYILYKKGKRQLICTLKDNMLAVVNN